MYKQASRNRRQRILYGTICLAPSVLLITAPGPATAVTLPAGNLVSACSGVSLPRSTVTSLVTPLVTAGVTPVQNGLNGILHDGALAGLLGGLAGTTVSVDLTGTLATVNSGAPITLQVVADDGNVIGPSAACYSRATGFALTTPAGLAMGGNLISGLGDANASAASAGEVNSIAFGNAASTAATATRSIALGTAATVAAGASGGVALGNQAQVTTAGGVAIGNAAQASGANSVALGASSVAARGAQASYTGYALVAPQASAGEVSVGAAGGERQVTNVAAGSAGTDAVNVNQLAAVGGRVDTLAAAAVTYDGASHGRVTLGGVGAAAPVALANVADGAVTAGSHDAVNGGQLAATNQAVAGATTAITATNANLATLRSDHDGLATAVTNGAVGTVRYSDAATPTTPNNGVPSDDLTLVGQSGGAVRLHDVGAGTIAAGSTDAVNGGQLATTNQAVAGNTTAIAGNTSAIAANSAAITANTANIATNASAIATTDTRVAAVTNGAAGILRYADAATPTTPNGGVASNDATLTTSAGGTVRLHNVGAGTVAAGSTDAVNGGQLASVSGQVATLADVAVTYDDPSHGRVTLGGAGATSPVALGNVAAGTVAMGSTDAVNGGQLATTNQAVAANGTAITNLDTRVTTNASAIATTDTRVAAVTNGAAGILRYADAATPTTPNGGVASNDATLTTSAGGTVRLHNVGAGTIAAGSTDAVNGGQLAATNQAVAGASSALTALSYNYDGFATAVTNGAVGTVRYSDAATPTTPNNGVPSDDLTLVGQSGGAVRLHDVADGRVAAGSTDAVNGGQLATLAGQLGAATADVVTYDDASHGRVTLGGAGAATPVALGNVADGAIAVGSHDAVTGGQLYTTNQAVTANGAAITGLDGRVTANTSDIATANAGLTTLTSNYMSFSASVANGGIGPVQYSDPGSPTTPNGGVPTNDLTLVGADGGNSVMLHNVGGGRIAFGSTDAINGDQFARLGSGIAGAFGALNYNPLTNSFSGGFTYAGNQYATVQDAFDAVGSTGGSSGNTEKYFHTNSSDADSIAGGANSTAIGATATSAGDQAVAMGMGATANSDNSVAIGTDAKAQSGMAVSIGLGNMAAGDGAVSIGDPNVAQGDGSVALGKDNGATGVGTIALGNTNVASGDGAAAIGSLNTATGDGTIAIGKANSASGLGTVVIGSANTVAGDNSVAIGNNISASSPNTLAIGNAVSATADDAMAIGNNAMATASGSVAFGSHAQATGFAAGALGTGAAATAAFSLAVGPGAAASAISSTALGVGAKTTGFASLALGSGSEGSADNSVALGSAVQTLRGGNSNYSAFGVGTGQNSNGEIAIAQTLSFPDPRTGVMTPTGNRQITGVAAGSADTDAVDVAQLRGVSGAIGNALADGLGGGSRYDAATGAITGPAYTVGGVTYGSVGDAIQALASRGAGAPGDDAVTYDSAAHNTVTLASGGTQVTSVAAGAVVTGSTDAVNGGQLAAVSARVDDNAAAIGSLAGRVQNGSIGTVQYSNAASPDMPNGGVRTNDVALVGADAAAPVGLHNVSAGAVATGSTDAVNGGQLAATNTRVAAAQATADTALTASQNAVQYDDAGHASATLGGQTAGGPVALHNVADGTRAGDAVNLGQLANAAGTAVAQSNGYTDMQVKALRFDLTAVRREAAAGSAGAMALAGMPQSYEAGRGMVAMGFGAFGGQSAVAIGLSKALGDEHTVVKAGTTYNSRGDVGVNGGVGYQF